VLADYGDPAAGGTPPPGMGHVAGGQAGTHDHRHDGRPVVGEPVATGEPRLNEPTRGAESSGDKLSDQLEARLHEPHVSIGALADVLDERGFAVVLMILMLPSALPIPTGGVTHVLEIFAALITLQMIVGREDLWIPRRLAGKELGETFTGKAAPKMLRFIRWFERHARPRLARLLDTRAAVSVLGVVLLVFVVGAFVAPPFSGLDTLPSLGVVVVCLGLVFSDGLIVAAGLVIGVVGLVLDVALGAALWSVL
jgi:hypothetical protein